MCECGLLGGECLGGEIKETEDFLQEVVGIKTKEDTVKNPA